MVRETRYLWVGNLPKEITEEGVIEFFARYGKIQSVKLLSGKEEDKPSATVAFMDIKSAAKAHKCENKLNGVPLFTEYSEPTATGTTVTITRTLDPDGTTRDTHRSVFNAQSSSKATARFPGRSDGLPEERNYDSQEYRYRVNEQYEGRRGTYEDGEPFTERGRLKQRFQKPQAMRAGFPSSNSRQQYEREVTSQRASFDSSYSGERHSERSGGSSAGTERRSRQKAWGGQSPARSDASLTRSRSFRRSTSRSPAGSRSSSSSSSRSSSSTSSRSRSRSSKASRDHQPSGPASVAIAPPNSLLDKRKESGGSASGSSTTETGERKNLGICIRGLPIRSSDTSLRDGLFHEYKKHGKVTSVNVVGNLDDRYAIVSFKKPEDAAKALEASQDKMFFGTKIHVQSHEGFVFPVEVEDNEFKPPEAELDEYHPKATRTLFVGNLEKEITTQTLREIFTKYGEIIDIDIKKQGAVSAYAFVQYADIVSVVRALRKMDGEHIGNNKIKLGFGKSMPTNCVWLDCMTESITEKKLCQTFGRYGPVSHSVIDAVKLRSLVYFENMDYAQHAVNEMRGRQLSGKKVQIDFASRDCQTAFFEKMQETHQLRPGERPDERQGRVFRQTPVSGRSGFQRTSGGGNSSSRNFRRGSGTTRFVGDTFSAEEFRERTGRQRFDGEFGTEGYPEDSYEQELRDYGYHQKERRERTDSLSPTRERRVEGRSVSPFSVRSSRHTSPTERHERFEDRYGERYSNSERFRDTDSQSGDHESVRSYRSVRSEARREYRGDRPFEERYAERFDGKTREARGFSPASSDYSQKSHSPGFQSRSPSPTPTKERKPKSAFGRPVTPPSPAGDYMYPSRASSPGDYEGIKEAKVKDKSKEETLKSRNMRERFDSEERTSIAKLMGKTTLTSIAGEVKLRKQKMEVEEVLTNAELDKSSKKAELERLLKKHPEFQLDKSLDSSDLRKIMEKSRSRSVSSVTRSRLSLEHGPADPPHSTVHRPVQEKNKLKEKVKHRKKYDKNAPYDPWDLPSGKSDSDSDMSGQVSSEEEPIAAAPGSTEYVTLQRERQHILQLIQQLDEGGSDGAEGAEEEARRMAKRARLEDCLTKNASPRLTSILESLKSNPKSGSFLPDASQSLRKQMEQRRRLEQQELRGDKSGPKLLSPPGDHAHMNHEDMDITYEKSPREIPVEFFTKKKRKPDHGEDMSFPKLKRSYRSKVANDDAYGPSSGDEGDYHGMPLRKGLDERLAEELGRFERPERSRKELLLSEPAVIKLNCDLGEPPPDPRPLPQHCPRHVLYLPLPRFAKSIPQQAPRISPIVQESPRAESPPPPPPPPPEDNSTKILSPPFSPGNKPYSPQDSPALKPDPSATDPHKVAVQTEDSKEGDKSRLMAPLLPAPHKSPAVKPESSDSEVETAVSPTALSLEERIRALDEKMNNAAKLPPVTPTSAILDYREKYKVRKRVDSSASPSSCGAAPPQPSDIVKRVLSRSSIFDQDSRRLEQIDEKYEPKDIDGVPLFWQKSATEDWPLLPPPMNTPLPTATLTAPSSGPPLPAVPAPLVVNLPLPSCSSAGATPISTPALNTPELAPQSAPPTMESTAFPMPKLETSALAARPGPPKKGAAAEPCKKLPPMLPTPVLNSSPSSVPQALDMPELIPKKDFMAQDSPPATAPVLKKQESTEPDWPATPPAKKEMPQLMAQTSREVSKDSPVKDVAKDTGKKDMSALLGKRKASEDKEKPAGKAEKHSSKAAGKAAAHTKPEPAKTEEPDAKRVKVAPPVKDKKHEKPHRESSTRESKKAASKHSKSPEKKSKQEAERDEKPKVEQEKTTKMEKPLVKDRAVDKARKEEKEAEPVKEKHRESSSHPERPVHRESSSHPERPVHRESSSHPERPVHRESSSHTERPVHRESSSHAERPVHRESSSHTERPVHRESSSHTEKPVHRESSSHRELPGHKDSSHKDSSSLVEKSSSHRETSLKESSSHRDSALFKESLLHKDNSSCKELSHKDALPQKEGSSSLKEGFPQGSFHKDTSLQKDSSPKESPAHRDSSSHRDTSHKESLSHKENAAHRDSSLHRESSGHREGSSHRDSAKDRSEVKDKPDGAGSKLTKDVKHKIEKSKDHIKEQNTADKGDKKVDKKEKSRSKSTDKHKDKTKEGSSENRSKAKTDSKSLERVDKHRSDKSHKTELHKTEKHDKKESDTKSETSDRSEDCREAVVDRKDSGDKSKEKSDSKTDSKPKDKSDKKVSKHSKSSHEKGKDEKEKVKSREKEDHKSDKSSSKTDKDSKSDRRRTQEKSKKKESRQTSLDDSKAESKAAPCLTKRELRELGIEEEPFQYVSMYDMVKRRSCKEREKEETKKQDEQKRRKQIQENRRRRSKSSRADDLYSSGIDSEEDEESETSVSTLESKRSSKKDMKKDGSKSKSTRNWVLGTSSDDDDDDDSQESNSVAEILRDKAGKKSPKVPKSPIYTESEDEDIKPKPKAKLKKKSKQMSLESDSDLDDFPSKPAPKSKEPESAKKGRRGSTKVKDEIPTPRTPNKMKGRDKKDRPKPPVFTSEESSDDIGPKLNSSDAKGGKKQNIIDSDEDDAEPDSVPSTPAPEILLPPPPTPPPSTPSSSTPSTPKSKNKEKKKDKGIKKKSTDSEKKPDSERKTETEKEESKSELPMDKSKEKVKSKTEGKKEESKEKGEEKKDRKESPTKSKKNKHKDKGKRLPSEDSRDSEKSAAKDDKASAENDNRHDKKIKKEMKKEKKPDFKPDPSVKSEESHVSMVTKVLKSPHVLENLDTRLDKIDPHILSPAKDNPLSSAIKKDKDLGMGILEKVNQDLNKNKPRVKDEQRVKKEKSLDREKSDKAHDGPINKVHSGDKDKKEEKSGKKKKTKKKRKSVTDEADTPKNEPKCQAEAHEDPENKLKDEARFRGDNIFEKMEMKEEVAEKSGLKEVKREELPCIPHEDISQPGSEDIEIQETVEISSGPDAAAARLSSLLDTDVLGHSGRQDCSRHNELEVNVPEPHLEVKEEVVEETELPFDNISTEDITEEVVTTDTFTDTIHSVPVDIASEIAIVHEEEIRDCKVPEDTSTSYTLISNVSNDDVSDCEPSDDLLLEMQTVEVESLEAKKEKEAKLAVAGRLEVSAKETEAAVAGLEELLKLDEPEPSLVIAEDPPFLISDSPELQVDPPKPSEEPPAPPEQVETGMSEEEKAVLALAEIAELTAEQINNDLDDPDDDATSKLVIAEPEDDRSVADEDKEDKTEDSDVELGTPTLSTHQALSTSDRALHKIDECSSGKDSDNDMDALLDESALDDDEASKEEESKPEEDVVNEMELMAAICSILPGSEEESAVAALQAQQDQEEEEESDSVPPAVSEDVPQNELQSTAAILDDSDDIKEPDSQEALTIDESKQDEEEEERKDTERLEDKDAEDDKHIDAVSESSEPSKEPPSDTTPQKTPEPSQPDPFDEAKSILPFREVPPAPFTETKPVSSSHYDIEKSLASHRQAKDPIHLDEDMDKPDFTSSESKPDADVSFSTDDYSGGLDDSFTSDKMEDGSQSPMGAEKKEETRTRRSRKTRRQANREREEEEETSAKSPGRVTRSQYEELEQPRTPGRRGVQDSTDKFSSYGRKIIPKERNDELTGFGRKGRKGSGDRSELEPRGRGRRAGISEESKQEVTRTRRGRRASLRQNKDDENADQEEMGQEDDKDEEKEAEGSDGEDTPGRNVRRTPRRRKSFRGRPGTRSYDREDEDGKEDEDTRRFSDDEKDDLDPPFEKEVESQAGESPRTRRGRRPKGRKSMDGSSSPRTRSADVGNASPRGRSLDGGATSPKAGEFSKPIVKLEKLNIDHTMKRDERRDEDLNQSGVPRFSFTRHGMRQQQQMMDGEKSECKPEKDLYAWEDDDEKPVPELKRIRKRKAGGDSPRCPLFEDTPETLPEAKRKKPCEDEDDKKPLVMEKQETGEFKINTDIKLEVVKTVDVTIPPVMKDMVPVKEQPGIEDLPKPMAPTAPKTPLSAKPATAPKPAVTPKTTPPPKPIPAKPAVVTTKPAPLPKPSPLMNATPIPKPNPEPIKHQVIPSSASPASTTETHNAHPQSNIDRIIDEVAKGNFERALVVEAAPVPQPVPTKKRHSRSKSREDPVLPMSPRPHYTGPISSAPPTSCTPMTSMTTSIPPTSSMVPASMSGLHGSPQVVFPPSRPDIPMSSCAPCSLPSASKSSFLMSTMSTGITSIPGMGQRSPMAKMPPMSQASSLAGFTMGTGSFMLERSGICSQAGMRRPSTHSTATSVITQTPNPGGIPTQNPIQALQRAGYPVTPQELDKNRNSSRSQKSVSHSGPMRGIDSITKSSGSSGPSTAGNSVHMGVVSPAYSIGQRETSPPGQVKVIEIMPNPNMKSPTHEGHGSGPQKGKEDGRPASRESGHGLPMGSMPGMQGQHGKEGHPAGLSGPLSAGMHVGFPPHAMYPGSGLVASTGSTTATSELRAALATPSKLHQQEQLQRLQQQQQPGMGPGMRPVTPHGPEHPAMVGHPRLSFPYQGPTPKTSPSADSKGHPFPPDLHKDGHGASAFTQLTQDRTGLHGDRPGMPPHHGEVRPGMPPHGDRPAGMHADIRPSMYPGDVRFPPPGMYTGSGLPMGMGPRMNLPSRMFPQHPDMFPGGMPPGLMHGQLPMGVPLEHTMERPGSSRPPSNQSSQPSPRPAQSTPSPGAAGHPSPIPGPSHHAGPMVPQHPASLPSGMAPRPAMGAPPMMMSHSAVVAHHTDQLYHILNHYPVVWQGVLALKNDSTTVQMHTLAGSQRLIKEALPAMDNLNLPLRIAQRMRLEPTQLDGVSRRMAKPEEFSMLLALPCGRDHMDVMQQTKTMRAGFIQYLQQKLAAGIVNVAAPGSGSIQPSYVVHIFPPCDFTQSNLESLAPELVRSLTEIDHLLIIIATVS